MIRNVAILAALPLLCLAPAAHADDDMAGARTPAGRVAVAWLEKAFNEGRMGEAFDLYVSRDQYRNHSGPPGIGDSFADQRAAEIKALVPGAEFHITQVIAQGDLVAVHVRVTHKDDDRVRELAEFIRVRGGKIVDHWDLHIPVRPDGKQFVDVNRFAGK